MFLSYFGVSLGANAAAVSIARSAVLNAAGVPYEYVERWDIQGQVFGDTQDALKTNINTVLELFSRHGGDLAITHNDGSTLSSHTLVNAATLSGIRVVRGPEFPIGIGAEYATYRTFNVSLEAEFPANAGDGLIDFQETLDFQGGGPLYAHLQTVNNPPPKQQIFQNTPYRAIQSGQAIGYLSWPVPPLPLWPGDLRVAPNVSRGSPRRRPNAYTHYPTRWTYEFESALPLLGNPNLWVG